jgi:Fic family protein
MDKQLNIINPPFDSPVTDLIIEIDNLRKRSLSGTTHPSIFFQLKHLFHILESIGSARIEGNHTTIAEFIDNEIDTPENTNESILEIRNNEKAINFIEENIERYPINRAFISELHKLVVSDLSREGSRTPGEFRLENPRITGSSHIPPDSTIVNDLMIELFDFINHPHPEKYDLIKVSIAHHRFVWIHPFDNGNGRTVRLLTYAMMIKMGFKVNQGRIINPTAVFCSNRDNYYNALQQADSGTENGMLYWIEYVLKGLNSEISKIDNLLEYSFVTERIFIPALKEALRKNIIDNQEFKVLEIAVKSQEFKTTQLNEVMKKSPVALSRIVKGLRDRKFLSPITESSRIYVFTFINNELMREIMKSLDKEGFLPMKDEI